MCTQPALAAALGHAGAVPALVALLRATDPASAGGLLSAFNSMLDAEPARIAALQSGAVPALTTCLLATGDAAGRLHVAATLAKLLRDDWRPAFDAAGWPVRGLHMT